MLVRKHHCRGCGLIFCGDCTDHRTIVEGKRYDQPGNTACWEPPSLSSAAVRVCDPCFFSSGYTDSSQASPQLYGQLRAMEEVSQALMAENRQVRLRGWLAAQLAIAASGHGA